MSAHEPSRQAVLAARNVSRWYGSVVALRNVSVELMAGEVTAIVGDNGAGKTTLLAVLAGVIKPSEGSIELRGAEVEFDSPRTAQDHGVATVYQDLALIDQRDVAANLFLGREPIRFGWFVDRRAMLRSAQDALSAMKLSMPHGRTLVGSLSGGQRQAVAIARTVVQGGDVVLMDEPTAALGVRESASILDYIRGLASSGTAVAVVSHNMSHVLEVADSVVVLRRGSVAGKRNAHETSQQELVGLIVGGSDSGASP